MAEKDEELFRQGWELFTRIFMKYDALEKSPLDLGSGERFSATQIHLVEAVGKGKGKTVTGLSQYFMVTKGAISQTVSQLVKMGYLRRVKRADNDKEILLELSDKGWAAFELHERYNQTTIAELNQLKEKYNPDEMQAFISILNDVDQILSGFVVEEKKRSL
jgi:DNA-binding MarR family transcriptional regulator